MSKIDNKPARHEVFVRDCECAKSRPCAENWEGALTLVILGGVTSCECSISKHSDVVLHGIKFIAADVFFYV